jgi:hypothetical protein
VDATQSRLIDGLIARPDLPLPFGFSERLRHTRRIEAGFAKRSIKGGLHGRLRMQRPRSAQIALRMPARQKPGVQKTRRACRRRSATSELDSGRRAARRIRLIGRARASLERGLPSSPRSRCQVARTACLDTRFLAPFGTHRPAGEPGVALGDLAGPPWVFVVDQEITSRIRALHTARGGVADRPADR